MVYYDFLKQMNIFKSTDLKMKFAIIIFIIITLFNITFDFKF
jgi:hypothetical protein